MEYVPAYYELGLCYELGQGVAKDQTQAKTYLIDGSVKGSIACIEHLIDYLWKECLASKNEMDYIKLYNYLRQTILAHPQNGKLHYTLGMLYEHGFGIKSDPKSALLHYQ
jgi:TPR repeat protein